MRVIAGKIVFVCGEVPQAGRNGQSSYNADVLQGLVGLGLEVEVIVTGADLGSFLSRSVRPPGISALTFLHGFNLGSRVVPTSIPAMARAFFSLAPSWAKALRRGRKGKAFIGRSLGASEAKRTEALIARASPEFVFADTIFRAGACQRSARGARMVLVAHDVFSERARSIAAEGYDVVPFITEACEAGLLARFDAVIAITDDDATSLRRLAPHAIVARVSPVIETFAASAPERTTSRNGADLFFLGSAALHNHDGLKWFLREVWADIMRLRPDARLHVVGAICDALMECPLNVSLHGRVADPSVIAASCAFAINPVLMGSGLKIKMLDYFRFGLPCVVTRVGAAGFPRQDDEPFVVADGAQMFRDAIVSLMENEGLAARLAMRTAAYVELFSPKAAQASLETVVEGLRHGRGALDDGVAS